MEENVDVNGENIDVEEENVNVNKVNIDVEEEMLS